MASNPLNEPMRLSDVFWTLDHARGGQYRIRDGLLCPASNVIIASGRQLGEDDVYGHDLPVFCEALLNTEWRNLDAVMSYHSAYGLYWRPDYTVRFADDSLTTTAYAVARFQAEILSLHVAMELAAALLSHDQISISRLVERCGRAKVALHDMSRRRHDGNYYSYTLDTNTWHELGESGTAVRFLGGGYLLAEDVDFRVALEPIPLLPQEWDSVRDAWAEDERLPQTTRGSIPQGYEHATEDVLGEISDILRVPSVRPYFETRERTGGYPFFLSFQLHDLADFVRLGIGSLRAAESKRVTFSSVSSVHTERL